MCLCNNGLMTAQGRKAMHRLRRHSLATTLIWTVLEFSCSLLGKMLSSPHSSWNSIVINFLRWLRGPAITENLLCHPYSSDGLPIPHLSGWWLTGGGNGSAATACA